MYLTIECIRDKSMNHEESRENRCVSVMHVYKHVWIFLAKSWTIFSADNGQIYVFP